MGVVTDTSWIDAFEFLSNVKTSVYVTIFHYLLREELHNGEGGRLCSPITARPQIFGPSKGQLF